MMKRMKKSCLLFTFSAAVASMGACAEVHLDRIELPDGFTIGIYADGVENARQMALGETGVLFVGSRHAGKVHAVVDEDGDQRADRVILVDDGLKMPSGIAFRDGALYVADIGRLLRYDAVETRLDDPPEPVQVTDALPDDEHHGWKYLRFGPDGLLYIPVGAPCNICLEEGYAEIRRLDLDTLEMDTWAEGVRNSVGFDFHPATGELWFTDNGRDMLGDNLPSCELNHAPRQGLHFGFPFCHQGDLPDPEFGDGVECSQYEDPEVLLGPHVAPLGMVFYTGDQFPEKYRNGIFIAEHGSWNRSDKIGYRVKLVLLDEAGEVLGQEVFASGWLQDETNWGRPADVFVMPDGALLVSDDQAGVIYRITYTGGT